MWTVVLLALASPTDTDITFGGQHIPAHAYNNTVLSAISGPNVITVGAAAFANTAALTVVHLPLYRNCFPRSLFSNSAYLSVCERCCTDSTAAGATVGPTTISNAIVPAATDNAVSSEEAASTAGAREAVVTTPGAAGTTPAGTGATRAASPGGDEDEHRHTIATALVLALVLVSVATFGIAMRSR